jgi:hypothetical protein
MRIEIINIANTIKVNKKALIRFFDIPKYSRNFVGIFKKKDYNTRKGVN